MTIALWPLLVAVVGALVFALAKDKAGELGRLAFFVGLLWLVYAMAGRTLHL